MKFTNLSEVENVDRGLSNMYRQIIPAYKNDDSDNDDKDM